MMDGGWAVCARVCVRVCLAVPAPRVCVCVCVVVVVLVVVDSGCVRWRSHNQEPDLG